MLVESICEWCKQTFIAHDYQKRRFCGHSCRAKCRATLENRCPDRNILVELYVQQELTPAQIGDRFGVQGQTIRHWLHRYEIPVRQAQTSTQFKPGLVPVHQKPIPDKLTLEYLYCDWKLTTRQIGEYFQVSDVTVQNWLKFHSISARALELA